MSCTREHYVEVAKKYLGFNEDVSKTASNSYMRILNAYDEGLVNTDVCRRWGTRNLKFTPNDKWHWCAAYVSAMAYLAGCADVVPYEMSVWSLMNMAKTAGIWKGHSFKPSIGDLVIFDWDGGCTETDHVGIVIEVGSNSFKTIEGNTGGHGSGDNYKGTVANRTVNFSNNIVTGFVHPNFATKPATEPVIDTEDDIDKLAREVINGKWGNGEYRKQKLTEAGHNYQVIQARVNAILKGTPVKEDENKPQYHTVVKGDTMWKISKKYGLTLQALIALNPQVKDPNWIYVGDKIRVK